MENDIKSVLISETELKAIVKRLGEQISKDYEGKELLLVSVLKGSVVFMGDLMRAIKIPCFIDFMSVSSYGNNTSSTGVVKIIKDLDTNVIEGTNLLIVEDILDSGRTLSYLKDILARRNPESIKICTLLDKPDRRTADIQADYVGIQIPDAFVVGYGLDFAERYRNLPYVGVIKPEAVERIKKESTDS
jgi:hypoxanthine phosphoribosyltransferase